MNSANASAAAHAPLSCTFPPIDGPVEPLYTINLYHFHSHLRKQYDIHTAVQDFPKYIKVLQI